MTNSHLFLEEKFFCCHFNLKNTPVLIFATFVFLNVIYEYKAKVLSMTGAPNFPGVLGPLWS